MPYLVQLPVELRGPEGVGLVEVLPQEEHQAAVVHIQGVVMPVHFWKQKEDLGVRLPNSVSVSAEQSSRSIT